MIARTFEHPLNTPRDIITAKENQINREVLTEIYPTLSLGCFSKIALLSHSLQYLVS